VDRFFSTLEHFRAIATRYQQHAANYLGLVKLAAARILMRCNAKLITDLWAGWIVRAR
jgi:transposase